MYVHARKKNLSGITLRIVVFEPKDRDGEAEEL